MESAHPSQLAPPPHRSKYHRTYCCSAAHQIAPAAASTASPRCPRTCARVSPQDRPRSWPSRYGARAVSCSIRSLCPPSTAAASGSPRARRQTPRCARSPASHTTPCPRRSEEHTSELQSQSNLVCRLLLEKKKHKSPPIVLTNR